MKAAAALAQQNWIAEPSWGSPAAHTYFMLHNACSKKVHFPAKSFQGERLGSGVLVGPGLGPRARPSLEPGPAWARPWALSVFYLFFIVQY